MKEPFPRLSYPGEGKTVRKLIHMAHPAIDIQRAEGLAMHVGNGEGQDIEDLILTSRRKGIKVEAKALFSMRIADSGYGRTAGMIYAGPPMNWVLGRNEIELVERKQLAERLVEVQLMAVLERFQNRGIGSLLLEDCERRYREHGYTMAMAIVNCSAGDDTIAWYEKRGYLFEAPNVPYKVRFWSGRDVTSLYDETMKDQAIGFKALTEGPVVKEEPVEFTPPGETEVLVYPHATASGLLD